MMTAMARLPCKSSTPTSQQQQQQQLQDQQQYLRKSNSNFGNGNRNYWDVQTRQPQAPSTYARNQHRQTIDHTGKRKSAVELLQESKAFYVKSETVLDRKQELKNSGHLQVAPSLTTTGAPTRLLRKCMNSPSCTAPQLANPGNACCWMNCQDRTDIVLSPQRTLPPALPPKSPRLTSVPQRRAISGPPSSTGGDQLQTKLRRLLNADSKENVYFPDTPGSLTPSNTSGRDEKFRFSPGGSPSPSNVPSPLPLPEVRFKFGRSNSHSHTSGKNSRKSTSSPPPTDTTICHKSLPDLHTSARRRASLSPRASTKSSTKPIGTLVTSHQTQLPGNCPDCETSSDYSDHSFKRDSVCYRSSRHIRRSLGSGGGDASSVLSSGGRTQKSSGSSKLSHGATARDSGGSSGHCTHRSEPPPRLQDCWSHNRRDSGASTQHSTEKDRSRKGSGYVSGGTPPSILRNFSPDSESSNSQTENSPTRNSRFLDGRKEGRGRPILRSKSDISDRYWRHDGNGKSKKVPPRPPRSVNELEIFFDCLGLDSDNYQRIAIPTPNSSSPVFFDSVSSVDSALGLHAWSGGNQQPNSNNCSVGNEATSQRASDPPSIVERNARIIKWLCQCRKVQFEYS